MTDIVPIEVEQMLADLPAEDWHALCARVRVPEQNPDPRVQAALKLREYRGSSREHRADVAPLDNNSSAPLGKQAAVDALRAMGHR